MTSQLITRIISGAEAAIVTTGTATKADPVNLSIYGETIPLLFGAARILGAPIWAAPVIDQDDGSRYVTAAYCFGHVDTLTTSSQIARIWMDGTLAYDVTNPGLAGQQLRYRYHGGSEAEAADPRIVAEEGANRTPAFRDRIYIVVEDWKVPEGALFPQCTAEIVQTVVQENAGYVTPLDYAQETFGSDTQNFGLALLLNADDNVIMCYAKDTGYISTYSLVTNNLIARFQPRVNGHLLTEQINGQLGGMSCIAKSMKQVYVAREETLAAYDYNGNFVYQADSLTGFSGLASYTASTSYNTNNVDEYNAVMGAQNGALLLHVLRRKGNAAASCAEMKFPGVAGSVITPVVWADQRHVSPHNDYCMGYFSTGKLIGICFVPDNDDTAVVGVQTVTYTEADGVPGGTVKTSLVVSGSAQKFVADLSNIAGIDHIIAMMVDPVASKWLSVLCLRNDGNLTVLKFKTPYDALGVITPGHKLNNGVPVKNPPPPVPVITDLSLFFRVDLPFGVDENSQLTYAFQSLPVGQTTISITSLFAPNNVNYILDMRDGSYRTFAGINNNFLFADGSHVPGTIDSKLGKYAIWLEALGQFVYAALAKSSSNAYPRPAYLKPYSATTTAAKLPLASLFTSLGILAGYKPTEIAVAGSVSEFVVGAIIDQPTTFIALVPLIAELFRVDVLEAGGQIVFKRKDRGAGYLPDVTLIEADLAVLDQGGSDIGALIKKTRTAASQLPNVIQTLYLDSDNSFDVGTQTAKRTQYPFKTSGGTKTLQLSVPVAMPAAEALYWTEYVLFDQWAEALTLELRLPQKWLGIEPGDYINLTTETYGIYVLKATAVSLNDDYSLSVEATTVLLASPGNTNINPIVTKQPDPPLPPPPSAAELFNVAVVDNFALRPSFGSETQASVWILCDKNLDVILSTAASDTAVLSVNANAVLGTLVEALPPVPDNFNTPDDGLTVHIKTPTAPQPVSELDFIAGLSVVLVGAPGRWEAIYFRDVTAVGDGTYRLGRVLRGQGGSDTVPLGRAGDAVVLPPSGSLATLGYPIPPTGEQAAVRVNVRGASPYAPGAKTVGVQLTGANLKPWRPLHIKAVNSNNSIVFTWDRQDRNPRTLHDNDGNIPQTEASEQYYIDFFDNNGHVVFSASNITAPTYALDTATASSYGISLTAPIVRVAEVSATVGAGFSRVAACPVN